MKTHSTRLTSIGLFALALAIRAGAEGTHAPQVRVTLQDGSSLEGHVTVAGENGSDGIRFEESNRIVPSAEIALAVIPTGAAATFVDCNDEGCKAVRAILSRCDASAALRGVLRGDYATLATVLEELRRWRDGPAYWDAIYGCGLLVATTAPDAAGLRVARILAEEARAARGTVPEKGAGRAVLVVAGALHRLGKTREADSLFCFWPISLDEVAVQCDGEAVDLGCQAALAVDALRAAEGEARAAPAIASDLAALRERLRTEADEDFDRYFLARPGTVYEYALESGGTTRVSLNRSGPSPDGEEYELLLEQAPARAAASRSLVTLVRRPFSVCWRLGDRLVPLSFLPCRRDTTWGWRLGEYEFVRSCVEIGGILARGTRLVSPANRFRQVSLRRPTGGTPIVVDTLQTYGPGCLLCDIQVMGREERPVYTIEEGR